MEENQLHPMECDDEEASQTIHNFVALTEPCKSVEGWVLFVSGIHPETQEDDIEDACSEFGKVTNLQLNLDRRSGFVKGYALVQFVDKHEAERAISAMNGSQLLGKTIGVGWAFVGKSNMDVSSGHAVRKKHKKDSEFTG